MRRLGHVSFTETANHRIPQCMPTVQSPKIRQGGTAPLSTVQHDGGYGSSHTCSPLDCLQRRQATHAIIHLHRFNELATNSGMGNPNWHETLFSTDYKQWNRKPKLAWDSLVLTMENSCGRTALDRPQWRDMTEQKDLTSKATIKSGFHLRRS